MSSTPSVPDLITSASDSITLIKQSRSSAFVRFYYQSCPSVYDLVRPSRRARCYSHIPQRGVHYYFELRIRWRIGRKVFSTVIIRTIRTNGKEKKEAEKKKKFTAYSEVLILAVISRVLLFSLPTSATIDEILRTD